MLKRVLGVYYDFYTLAPVRQRHCARLASTAMIPRAFAISCPLYERAEGTFVWDCYHAVLNHGVVVCTKQILILQRSHFNSGGLRAEA